MALRALIKRPACLFIYYFKYGISSFFNFAFLSYNLDSYRTFHKHPEFNKLLSYFIESNKSNNCGDLARLWFVILNTKQIIDHSIVGYFAELGVWYGNIFHIHAYFSSLSNRRLFLFDTFSGFDSRNLSGIDRNVNVQFQHNSLLRVQKKLIDHLDRITFVPGYFSESLDGQQMSEKFPVVSLDCDLYPSSKDALAFFFPRMSIVGLFSYMIIQANIGQVVRAQLMNFFLRLMNRSF